MSMNKQKGVSTVEFAMLVPVLLLLVVMVSEFGMMFYRLNAMTKSVQVAARYLSDISVNPNIALTDAQVKNLICSGTIGGAGTEIVPDCNTKLVLTSPSAAANHLTVSAAYPADWILPNAVAWLLGLPSDSMMLTASSVMRFAR
jgi:Flp pilus assembly protein TadG